MRTVKITLADDTKEDAKALNNEHELIANTLEQVTKVFKIYKQSKLDGSITQEINIYCT